MRESYSKTLVSSIIIVLFLSANIFAQSFSDDFSNLDSWDVIRGDWRVDSNTLVGYWSLGSADNIDGVLQLKTTTFQSDSWTAQWEFIYSQDSISTTYYKASTSFKNYIDLDNFISIGLGAGDYGWPGSPMDSITWSIAGMNAGVSYSVSAGVEYVSWDPQVWNAIKIIKIDSLFKFYLNDTFLASRIDTVHNGTGQFALSTYGTSIHQNFSITSDVPPELPGNLTATGEDYLIDLSWDPVADPNMWYYKIYRNERSDILSADSLDLEYHPGTTYSDNNVVPGVRYYYWLCAVDSNNNESSWAGPVNALCQDPLYAPTELKLYPAGTDVGDNFGYSVNAFGNDLIVGAIFGDGFTDSTGAAHVFNLIGSNWAEQGKLFGSDGAEGDLFGHSVDICGEFAIVGAPFHESHTGAAYLFQRTGITWSQVAKLTASDAALGDEFGVSVSIDGDWLMVGAEQDDDRGDASGSVYVFHRDGQNWNEIQKLTGSATSTQNLFGTSMEIYGDYVVIGAHRNGGESAYVFKKNDNAWSEQQILTTSEPGTNYFGFFVDIEQDVIAVGAINSNVNGISGSGSAFVFRRSGETWIQEAMLIAPDADNLDYFGRVRILGDYILCSSPYDDDHGSRSGSAYLYHYTGSGWDPVVKLTPSDGATDDIYASGYVLIKNFIMIGSYWDDDNGSGSGAVYQYTMPQDITDNPDEIDNNVFTAHFDHSLGMIDSLVFKPGSNQDLIDQAWNASNTRGLGRLGELDDGTTQLTAINLFSDSATIHYTSKNYGDKKFYLRWSDLTGLEIDMVFNLNVEALEGNTWEPGGSNDSADSIKIVKGNASTETIPFTYPGVYQAMYYDLAWATGSWDGNYDEVYGYAFKNLHQVAVGNGTSADGPFHSVSAGEDTLYFAVKSANEYWNWVSNVTGYQSIDFTLALTVTDYLGTTKDIVLGTDPMGSDGYDAGLDLYAPPLPLPGAFDARFSKDSEDYITDIRQTNAGTIIWEISFQESAGGSPVTINWDSTALPQGRFEMIDVATNGILVNINMRNQSSFTDLFALANFQIIYTLAEAQGVYMAQGWNIIGLPYIPGDNFYKTLFPQSIDGTLYRFNGIYEDTTHLDPGQGYWLRYANSEMVPVTGYPITDLTLDLSEGWNLIAGISEDVPIAGVEDLGNIIIPNTLFGFDGVYVSANVLEQGKGFWIRTNTAGQISLLSGASALPKQIWNAPDISEYTTMSIRDHAGKEQILLLVDEPIDQQLLMQFSLPPLPPAGAFDSRFIGDYRLANKDNALIRIQASEYPLSISFSHLENQISVSYLLEEMTGSKVVKTTPIVMGTDIKINEREVNFLRIREIRSIPNEFVMYQNYPNPFNPVTTIKYGIPRSDKVEIMIFNTIGQKVKSLLNTYQEAGYHQVEWDGTNDSGHKVSSGVYMYLVKSGRSQKVMKMVLLK